MRCEYKSVIYLSVLWYWKRFQVFCELMFYHVIYVSKIKRSICCVHFYINVRIYETVITFYWFCLFVLYTICEIEMSGEEQLKEQWIGTWNLMKVIDRMSFNERRERDDIDNDSYEYEISKMKGFLIISV